jgi:hypothetical protein
MVTTRGAITGEPLYPPAPIDTTYAVGFGEAKPHPNCLLLAGIGRERGQYQPNGIRSWRTTPSKPLAEELTAQV